MARDPILAVLGPGGLLAKAVEGYEHRPQQIEMARLVHAALAGKRYALVEAGTGTGKTLAYLVPAALCGKKVVLSTATKTLQEQVVLKDLPLLSSAAGIDLDATVLKGRSNYLCLSRFERVDEDPSFMLATKEDARTLPKITAWASRTQTGDRAELDLPERLPVWKQLSATSETCTGQRCPRYEDCFVTRVRRRAAESDLVIVNHHLFFADLSLRTSKGAGRGAEVIPAYDAVIFDEAHALEDTATEHFGVSASTWRIEDLSNDALRISWEAEDLTDPSARLDKIERHSDQLFREAARLMPKGSEQAQRLTPARAQPLKPHARALCDALRALKALWSRSDDPDVQGLARRALEIANDVERLAAADDPDLVYWTESRARATFLRAAPIDVSQELASRLYAATDTLVFTSATLATQGRFDFVKRRLGLVDPETGKDRYRVDVLRLDSPFDYRAQAALYAPTHLPEPADAAFVGEVAEEILALCEITKGRAFALFTSLKNMTEAHRLLKDRLPYRVLLQGERPKRALLAQFREVPSVLFASQSFWEGVDVAGEALSLVVIDKLPFASPADPVVAARVDQLKGRGKDAFSEYQVPQAALALRQGFGRLIRTRKDRGVVAILDRRLTTKRYGKAFLESLPPCSRHTTVAGVQAWWEFSGNAFGNQGQEGNCG